MRKKGEELRYLILDCKHKGELNMEPNVFDKVHEVDLKKTMEQSYIDYAMSVISARAPA